MTNVNGDNFYLWWASITMKGTYQLPRLDLKREIVMATLKFYKIKKSMFLSQQAVTYFDFKNVQ